MTIYILIIFLVIIVAAIGGTTWFVLRTRRLAKTEKATKEAIKPDRLPFRWNYIMLPLIILSLSIAMSAYFYPKLPAEVAIQLKFDGVPDRWLSREMTMAFTLGPQIGLTILGAGITWIMARLGVLSKQTWSSRVRPETLLWLMGNLLALPQGVLCFTMFNIFLYNSYQIQLMPTWLFLLIILGIGGALLGLFLVFIIFRARQRPASQSEETESTKNG